MRPASQQRASAAAPGWGMNRQVVSWDVGIFATCQRPIRRRIFNVEAGGLFPDDLRGEPKDGITRRLSEAA